MDGYSTPQRLRRQAYHWLDAPAGEQQVRKGPLAIGAATRLGKE
jgi:hypothetical protein